MYAVGDDFLEVVQKNTRNYYWSGTITTTKGTVYEFDYDDILRPAAISRRSRHCLANEDVEPIAFTSYLLHPALLRLLLE